MVHTVLIALLILVIVGLVVALFRIQPESAASERRRRRGVITGQTGQMPQVLADAMDNQERTTVIPVQMGPLNSVRTDTVMMRAVRPTR